MNSTSERSWNGPLCAIALTLLAVVLVADVLAMDMAEQRISRGNVSPVADGLVHVTEVRASPGDTVTALANPSPRDPLGAVTFYLAEPGAGEVFRQGERPATVHHEQAYAPGSAPDFIHLERPRPAGTDPGWVALVWVYEYAASPPTDPQARTYFDAWAREAAIAASQTPVVVQGWAAPVHTTAMAVAAIAGLVAAVTGARWAWEALRASREEGGDGPTASAVSFVHVAGGYLSSLRALLVGLAAPILYAGWVTVAFVWSTMSELAGPSPDWGGGVRFGLLALWAAIAVLWLVQTLRVHRALGRWRRTVQERPLEG